MALGEYTVFDPFSRLRFPVYTDNHSSLYPRSLTLLKHFLITKIRLPVSEQRPSPHLCVSDPAPTDPSEHLFSDLGMLMVAAVPDKPTGGWISPPRASTPFVPQKANVGGDPPHAGCATVSHRREPRGQRSMEDMPQLLCFSFTCIRGFWAFWCCAFLFLLAFILLAFLAGF